MPSKERRDRDKAKQQSDKNSGEGSASSSSSSTDQPVKETSAFVSRDAGEGQPAKNSKRLGFNVVDGRVDVESIQDAKKKELIAAIKGSPEFLKLLGQEAVDEVQFTAKDIEQALAFLNGVNKFSTKVVLARFKKFEIDQDIMDRCFDNSDPVAQKELIERGTRLANKYSTEWMRKYADEIFFAALYLKWVTAQVMGCVILQDQRNQAKQPPAPAKVNGQAAVGQGAAQ